MGPSLLILEVLLVVFMVMENMEDFSGAESSPQSEKRSMFKSAILAATAVAKFKQRTKRQIKRPSSLDLSNCSFVYWYEFFC